MVSKRKEGKKERKKEREKAKKKTFLKEVCVRCINESREAK